MLEFVLWFLLLLLFKVEKKMVALDIMPQKIAENAPLRSFESIGEYYVNNICTWAKMVWSVPISWNQSVNFHFQSYRTNEKSAGENALATVGIFPSQFEPIFRHNLCVCVF